MTKLSTLKNQLVMTTALAAALFGYSRRAYAACTVTVSPNYLCSGYNAAPQNILLVNNANVYTDGTFSVNAAGAGSAITITGDGALSFTDANASTLYGFNSGLRMTATGNAIGPPVPGSITINADSIITAYSGVGIFAVNLGDGALSITADGDIAAQFNGIYARSFGSSISIDTGAGNTISGTIFDGIFAQNTGSGALTITAKGDVMGGYYGIYARNLSISSADLTVTTGVDSTVKSTVFEGIHASNSGTGDLTVTANGDVTGAQRGIFAYNIFGSNLSITTGVDSSIIGTTNEGIDARNSSTGALTINAKGDVSGGIKGIYAYNSSNSSGALSITAAGNVTGTSKYGIEVKNKAANALMIDVKGDVIGGKKGIRARNYVGSTGLTIATGKNSSITGSKSQGIDAANHGSGDLKITANGDVYGFIDGIQTVNYGNNLIIATGASSNITSKYAIGIVAQNAGSGTLTLAVGGNVTAGGYYGIYAHNNASGTALTITTEAASNITGAMNFGIFAKNQGAGVLKIDAKGDVLGGQRGIYAYNSPNSTGALSITAGGDVTGTSKYGIQAKNYTTNGSSSLSITAGNVTSNSSGIQARNKAGALTVGISGAVVANGGPGVYGTNTSGTDINITTDAGSSVKALSWAIGAYNNGTGAETIDVGGDATGGQFGVLAVNHGAGPLKITTEGKISGASVAGIVGSNTGLDMTVITATDVLSKSGTGIWAINGKGLLFIANHGNVSAGTIGINATNSGTNLTIATGKGTTITGTKTSGIQVQNNGSGDTLITNSKGATISGGTTGVTALNGNAVSGLLINEKTATITGATGIIVAGNGLAGSSGGISNYGTIQGTGNNAISFVGLTGETHLTLYDGDILGDVVDDNMLNGYSQVAVAGDITAKGNFNVGDFNVSEGATFTLGDGFTVASYNTVDIDGIFSIQSDPTIAGDVNVHAKGLLDVLADTAITGDLQNNGMTSIATGTTVTAGTMSVGTKGTLSFGVTSKTDHGQLTLDSGPGVMTGQTVTIDLAKVNGITLSTAVLLIDGTTALIDGPGKAGVPVADNSPFWSFKIVDGTASHADFHTGAGASDLYLVVDKSATLENIPGNIHDTPNNEHAAETLLDLPDDPGPELEEIVDNLVNSSSPDETRHILESVQPAADGGSVVSTLTFVDSSINLVTERLNTLAGNEAGSTGLAAGENSSLSGRRVWSQVSGQNAQQGFRDNISGFDSSLMAATVGMDTENIFDRGILGFALSYGNTHIDSLNANRTDTDIDSYQTTLYSDYDLGRNYYLNGIVSGAFNSHTTLRHDVGAIPGLNAYGDFNSWQAAARAEAGRSFYVGSGIFTPMAMMNWVYYKAEGYTETGAGSASLNVGTQALNQLDLGLGGKLSGKITYDDGTRLVPEVHAGYRREMLGQKLETSSSFIGGGAAFSGEGPDPAQDKFNLGAQMKYYALGDMELTAAYDFDIKQDFMAHAGFLRAGWRF